MKKDFIVMLLFTWLAVTFVKDDAGMAICFILFLVGAWIFFDPGEMAFVMYAVIYFVLGISAMLLSIFINKKLKID